LNREQCPTYKEEREEYQLHNNNPFDAGYRKYLSKVTNPMIDYLERIVCQDINILDFGCGPGPTISVVLGEKGWVVQNYDPIFFPDKRALQFHYDLVSSTEVVEHFHEPRVGWDQLVSLLTDNGHLIVMTQCSDPYLNPKEFQQWRYIRERSHVVFYHSQTMKWIAKNYELQLTKLSSNVFWFSRSIATS
jgi:2-polyprenyl-3-methyl-5-hydroxy-6-metoxy-1,4-benzoquinol methylase